MHQYLNLPLNVVAGLSAGFLRELAKDREAIWSFSPLFDLSIYRWIRRTIAKSFIDWQTSFFFMILGLQFLRLETRRFFRAIPGRWIPRTGWCALRSTSASVMTVAIALKVLNNTRIEMKLEEQERLLLQARMEALQSQINPHFLFNTLNSVASLVRFDPDTAREMILKLSKILRRLLKKGDSFVELREEFEFIDDYLDIEVIRFGRDKLKVVKELDAASLEVVDSHHAHPAHRGEFNQAWAVPQNQRRHDLSAQPNSWGDAGDRGGGRRGWHRRTRLRRERVEHPTARNRNRHGECPREAQRALQRCGPG